MGLRSFVIVAGCARLLFSCRGWIFLFFGHFCYMVRGCDMSLYPRGISGFLLCGKWEAFFRNVGVSVGDERGEHLQAGRAAGGEFRGCGVGSIWGAVCRPIVGATLV